VGSNVRLRSGFKGTFDKSLGSRLSLIGPDFDPYFFLLWPLIRELEKYICTGYCIRYVFVHAHVLTERESKLRLDQFTIAN
jgi:hypothetical protein